MKTRNLKICLKVFTVFFIISGITMIAVSAYVFADLGHTKHISYIVQGPSVIMAIGGFVVLFLASIGFIGIVREKPPYLLTYIIGLSGIAAIELYVALTTGVRYRHINLHLRNDLKISLSQYYNDQYDKSFWDIFQSSKACCGIDSYLDWDVENLDLPESCCREKPAENVYEDHRMCAKFDRKHIYKYGCYQTILNLLKADQKHLCIFTTIVSLAEIVGIAFTWILLRRVKKHSGSMPDAEDRFQHNDNK